VLNFSQSALDAATHKRFHNDPTPINAILLSLGVLIGLVLVGYVWTKSGKIARENLEEQAEGARERLIPNELAGNGTAAHDYGAVEERGRKGRASN